MIDAHQLVKVQTLVKAGRLNEAKMLLGQIACTIPQPDDVTTQFEANQVMEVCGAIGQTLRKNGQLEMALPWLSTLCKFARKFAPTSVDTAWDHYHYAESLIEYADSLAEPARTNCRKRASTMCDEARRINHTSNNPSSRLAEKIRHLIRRCT
jgi:hypothetical protein